MKTETESAVPIQIVNEIPISLQMPADVRLSTELNKDNRLSRRDEYDRWAIEAESESDRILMDVTRDVDETSL